MARAKIVAIEEGKCPYCGSTNVDYGCLEMLDEMGYYPVSCADCGKSFREWYSVKYEGIAVGDKGLLLFPGNEGVEVEVQ